MPRNTLNTRPLAMPRGITYYLGCRWPSGGGISWFDPENHKPTGHNLFGTIGLLHSTEPIIKSISTSWNEDQTFEPNFVPGRIEIIFEWVDTDGNVLHDGAVFSQGYGFNDPSAYLPVFVFLGPYATLDNVILKRPAGIKQTITINPGHVNLVADVGLTSATIWLGATL